MKTLYEIVYSYAEIKNTHGEYWTDINHEVLYAETREEAEYICSILPRFKSIKYLGRFRDERATAMLATSRNNQELFQKIDSLEEQIREAKKAIQQYQF